jgi:hypothetical protein
MTDRGWLKNWKTEKIEDPMVKSMTPSPSMTEILMRQQSAALKADAMLETISAGMIDTFDMKNMQKLIEETLRVPSISQPNPSRNYEAAVYSRLDVLGPSRRFDLMSIYRNKEGKFFIFVVVNEKWIVFEDDELFPSDKLISALRCLKL